MAEYVNNREFFTKYCEWKVEYRSALDAGIEPPIPTNYLGDCIIKICNNLSHRYNFVGYSYRDEMAEDGIESCIKAIAKFDETKYQNIFGYFSQIAFHASVKRIKIEKREQLLKIELIKDCIFEGISRQEFDDEEYQMQMRDIIVSTIDNNSVDDTIHASGITDLIEPKNKGVDESIAECLEMDIYD